MMIIVVVTFAICWLPQHIYIFVWAMGKIDQQIWSQPLYLAFYWLAMSNAMYNPLIYCWMNARWGQPLFWKYEIWEYSGNLIILVDFEFVRTPMVFVGPHNWTFCRSMKR